MVVRFLATSRAEIPRFPSSKIEKFLATQVYSLFAPRVKNAKRYLKKAINGTPYCTGSLIIYEMNGNYNHSGIIILAT